VGCVLKGQTYVGTILGGQSLSTDAGALQFIISPTTGQSTPEKFAEAEFIVTLNGDNIEAITPEQSFKVSADLDSASFAQIAAACGGPGTALDAAHSAPGTVCEDFDTDRNTSVGYQWSRLYAAVHPNGDPLRGLEDPNDDVIGHSVDGGAVPFGIDGQICSSDFPFAAARIDCWVVPSENDWHIHSSTEGCDVTYGNSGTFASRCDGGLPRAHSGTRSMHMGRHLNATDTLFDTYRFRQTSAFITDPYIYGTSTSMEFWHIIQVATWKVIGTGKPTTNAGTQVHLSLQDPATGFFERWQRLNPTQNGYDVVDQEAFTICEFDPGDDQFPGTNEPMCGGQPQWGDIGDFYGSDETCTVDEDGNDPTDKDCGQTTNRTVVGGCSWVTDPNCGSFLENGITGPGVWARSQFDLASFAGRIARLRWVGEMGGGWSFHESRSFLEPEPGGNPSQLYDGDEGWYIDDIKITDLRTAPAFTVVDPDGGTTSCPSRGATGNCGAITVRVAGAAIDSDPNAPGGSLDTLLFAQSSNLGTRVLLDARQSAADIDPGDPNFLAGGGCKAGVLEYEWSQLDDHLGNVVSVVSPFSPKADVTVTTPADATYRVDVRCSSDPGCTRSQEVNVLVYTGDGSDVNSEVHNHSPIGLLDGIYADHDPGTCDQDPNSPSFHTCLSPSVAVGAVCTVGLDCGRGATLSWRARPQPTGVSGYDLFKRTVTVIGADVFASDRFQADAGAGGCIDNVANLLPGTRVTRIDSAASLAVGQAWLYMLGHDSNNALAIAPLGRRPSVSNRAGTLVSASRTCP
jgi:hypothetical protein